MTNEELMQPRYKVIERWPDMHMLKFFTDQIITLNQKEGSQWFIDMGKTKPYDNYYDAYFEGYPHLFKKLEWWEEREPDDMPDYVKGESEVYKVLSNPTGITDVVYAKWILPHNKNAMRLLSLSKTVPATEEEYLAYQNTA